MTVLDLTEDALFELFSRYIDGLIELTTAEIDLICAALDELAAD